MLRYVYVNRISLTSYIYKYTHSNMAVYAIDRQLEYYGRIYIYITAEGFGGRGGRAYKIPFSPLQGIILYVCIRV